VMATQSEQMGTSSMQNSGGDRYMTGPEFFAARKKVCDDRQVFARVSGVPIRTLAAFELGQTHRPREYRKLMDTLGRFRRGEVTDRTVLPPGEGLVEEVEIEPGITFLLRAEDHANLGAYRRAQDAMRRVLRELGVDR
jgi:DNA-binding transcriptional regulator YiaG